MMLHACVMVDCTNGVNEQAIEPEVWSLKLDNYNINL